MKKLSYIGITVLQVILFISAYMVNYFTTKKMGMRRHVIARNAKWESIYPIDQIKIIAVILLIAGLVAIFVVYKKNKFSPKIKAVDIFISCLMVFLFVGFVFVSGPKTIRAYYYIAALGGIATILQLFKTLIYR